MPVLSLRRPVSVSAALLLAHLALAAIGVSGGVMAGSGMARADASVPPDLHICNADEITTIPDLQSDDANDCINDQSTNADDIPKALMCAPTGKAYCCTQKVDQLGQCKPVTGGRKRTVPIRDPNTVPLGEPGAAPVLENSQPQ